MISLLLYVPLLVLAQDNALNRSSLKDLDGVRVVVEDLPASIKAEGLAQEQLRKSVEAKLAAARIPVLNPGEFPVGDPFLRVRITATPRQKGMLAYRVEIDFAQIVFLRRNPMITFNRAQTWAATPVMGLSPMAGLAERIDRAMEQQVAQFIAAYVAVNPKSVNPK